MIQLLQLQLYNPDPVSISNIGHSNIGHLKYWPLPGFSSRRLITSSTWEYVWPQQTSVGSMRESDICTCVSKMSQSRVKSPALQGVSWEVPLDRLLDWVGALEELFASLLAIGSLGSVHVFVQQLPEVIWHVQDLKVSGHPEKSTMWKCAKNYCFVHLLEAWLQLAGHIAKVFGLPHHLADQLLLALQVVVVKLFVHLGKCFWLTVASTSTEPLGALKSTGSHSSRSFPPEQTCAENTAPIE